MHDSEKKELVGLALLLAMFGTVLTATGVVMLGAWRTALVASVVAVCWVWITVSVWISEGGR